MSRKRVAYALLMVILALYWAVPAAAYDVWGPFNNTQTAISIDTTDEGSKSIVALNARDQSDIYASGGQRFALYSNAQILPPPLDPPYPAFDWWQFRDDNLDAYPWFNQFIRFPSMLQPTVDNWSYFQQAVASHGAVACVAAGEWNNAWYTRVGINPPANLFPSRMYAPRNKMRHQYVGCDWTNPGSAQRLITTSDGWINASYPAVAGLPASSMIYSLAFDDGNGQRGIAVVAGQGDGLNGALYQNLDPHTDHIATYRVYYTLDGGANWQLIPNQGPLQQPLWNVHNLQVSIIPAQTWDLNGDYYVYLMGIYDPTGTPSMWFRYTRWLANGTFNAWAFQANPFSAGSVALPNYPYDLITERNLAADSIQLLVATQGGMYYAKYTGAGAITWSSRMNGVPTYNFHDIAVDPEARYKTWAVAGQSCSYITYNAGASWSQIHHLGLKTYPSHAARQYTDSMVVVYGRIPLASRPTNQTHYAPICSQVSTHQQNDEPIAFGRTTHIAWTYPDYIKRVPYDLWRTNPRRFIMAHADPFLGVNPVPLYTKGVVRVTANRGQTWGGCMFENRNWNGALGSVPIPSHLVTDPSDTLYAFISFENCNGNAAVTDIPPFCYSATSGSTWITPANTNLPIGGGERRIAVGRYEGGSRHIYLSYRDQVYHSENLGTTWDQLTLPLQFNGEQILSVSTPNQFGKFVVVATRVGFAYSEDYGFSWSPVIPPMNGQLERAICSPIQPIGAPYRFWAVTTETTGTPIRVLWTSFDSGVTWTALEIWGDAGINYYPAETDLYIEKIGDMRCRAIWTCVNSAANDDQNGSWPWPVIKYFEDPMPGPQLPTAVEKPATDLPTEFALSQNYPNPFNPTTTIRFDLKDAGLVTLKVFDITGREVATLENGMMSAGRYQRSFDGSALASGVYLVRLDAPGFTATRKMMLLK